MAIQERLYTAADLRAIEALSENQDKRFELIKGVIYEVPYPTPMHNLFVGNIHSPIREFVRARKLGYAFTDTVKYSLPNGDEFAPDVSFVSKERQTLPLPKEFAIAPDMAVEVASPSNRERELLDKAQSMLECGTHFVWVVYPASKVVDVCHLAPDGTLNTRSVGIDETLDGEDILPGFTLSVRDIFDI
ncbi:MAG: Uma2 family endonuclease [Burkholderiales bacterium]|nr:Uma2 family endonuclease [Anaerolineae bacterium]